MTPQDEKRPFRSGFVPIAGRPNVGKSTLINALLGQPIAAVSPRPQTTQRQQLGILTLPDAQIVFVDTPGLHKPRHKLGEQMNISAQAAIADGDLVLVLFDLTAPPGDEDIQVRDALLALDPAPPMLMALTKLDLVPEDRLADRRTVFQALLPDVEVVAISTFRPESLTGLIEKILERLPEGPQYYPEEELTATYEREIAAELIRAASLRLLREEVPYCIAIRIDDFKDRGEGAYIGATLFVERDSQKGIVIGSGGAMLRNIGTMARKDIEAMLQKKVFLDLHVKVMQNWRNDPGALKRFGYISSDS
ncbi:MAG: GTPase Era [Anaerolineales bacterium]|nr:GTPase Era [Anaerolineales bacterium]